MVQSRRYTLLFNTCSVIRTYGAQNTQEACQTLASTKDRLVIKRKCPVDRSLSSYPDLISLIEAIDIGTNILVIGYSPMAA